MSGDFLVCIYSIKIVLISGYALINGAPFVGWILKLFCTRRSRLLYSLGGGEQLYGKSWGSGNTPGIVRSNEIRSNYIFFTDWVTLRSENKMKDLG